MSDDIKTKDIAKVFGGLAATIGLTVGGCMYIQPNYNVYHQTLAGEAKLKEAESSRQILTQEAHAKLESSKFLAQAEIERAKGVAEANRIIGEGLKGQAEYLRYLWIHALAERDNATIIYVPTESGLPILEASRLNAKK